MPEMTLEEAMFHLNTKRRDKILALKHDNIPKAMELVATINYLTGYITGICEIRGIDKEMYLKEPSLD